MTSNISKKFIFFSLCFFKRNRTPLKSSKGLEGVKHVYTTIYHSKASATVDFSGVQCCKQVHLKGIIGNL